MFWELLVLACSSICVLGDIHKENQDIKEFLNFETSQTAFQFYHSRELLKLGKELKFLFLENNSKLYSNHANHQRPKWFTYFFKPVKGFFKANHYSTIARAPPSVINFNPLAYQNYLKIKYSNLTFNESYILVKNLLSFLKLGKERYQFSNKYSNCTHKLKASLSHSFLFSQESSSDMQKLKKTLREGLYNFRIKNFLSSRLISSKTLSISTSKKLSLVLQLKEMKFLNNRA